MDYPVCGRVVLEILKFLVYEIVEIPTCSIKYHNLKPKFMMIYLEKIVRDGLFFNGGYITV